MKLSTLPKETQLAKGKQRTSDEKVFKTALKHKEIDTSDKRWGDYLEQILE